MQQPLSELVKLPEYREGRQHIFPGKHSLEWFLRQHKPGLIEAGAMLMLTGQWFVVPKQFDAYVAEVGKKAAQRLVEAAQ
jgi:hypothetical protein